MNDHLPYQFIADAVLALHAAIVVFVVGGLALIVAGNLLGWPWVNSYRFRLAHLVAIAVVASESWFGIVCPLTSLEMSLRARAGAAAYADSFVQHWLQRILYYDAPPWIFTVSYTLFGLAVAAAWWYFPPSSNRRPTLMPLVFSYGTLQRDDVQLSTFGRCLRGQKDALVGFEPSRVPIADPIVAAATGRTHHANVTWNGRSDSRVDGMAFELCDAEVAAADRYEEAALYKRIAVRLASGKEAWVYVDAKSAPVTEAK